VLQLLAGEDRNKENRCALAYGGVAVSQGLAMRFPAMSDSDFPYSVFDLIPPLRRLDSLLPGSANHSLGQQACDILHHNFSLPWFTETMPVSDKPRRL